MSDGDVELLTVPQTAARLKVTRGTVYALISSGALRPVDISRPGSKQSKTRIRVDDLAAFIESRTRRAS